MVQQHVALLEGREHVSRGRRLHLGQVGVGRRQERRVLQLGPVALGEREQTAQVERPRHVEHLAVGDAELLEQEVEHLGVDVVLDLQADRGPVDAPPQQLLLQGEQQVLGVVLLDLDVLVAGHPEDVVAHDLHAAEQLVEVAGDHVLEWDEAALGEREEPLQHRRHLDPGELAYAGLGVANPHDEVDRQPGDVGERVRRVDRERGQDREDPLVEQDLHPVLLALCELVPAQDLDALLGQLGPHLVGEDPGLLGDQLPGAVEDGAVHVTGQHPAHRGHGHAGRDPPLQPRDPDHVELVQVGGEDRQELGPLEQRHPAPVLGQVEHPVVEAEPGQLAVEEPVRGEGLRLRQLRRAGSVRGEGLSGELLRGELLDRDRGHGFHQLSSRARVGRWAYITSRPTGVNP